ncbi:hypothetical protein [Acidithiobacillus ferriphilus]|uniref:hypothetical protein n=2 Tax=Acidithiobacillus ferriphilus TaxID=1689834 RepID=UPI001C0629BE|nr:hypothetical protein [Acidithiobacillus ferriphilus]
MPCLMRAPARRYGVLSPGRINKRQDNGWAILPERPQNRSTGTLGAFAGLFIVNTEPQHHQGIAGHCEHLSGTAHYPA